MKIINNSKFFLVALTLLFTTIQVPMSVSAHDGPHRDAHTVEQLHDQWLELVENYLVQNEVLEKSPQAASLGPEHADFNRPVTKAQFIKMLVKSVYSKTDLKRQIGAGSTCSFSSVKDKDACKYLEVAKKGQFLSGYPAGAFTPESPITRAELLFFTFKMMPNKLISEGIRQTFTDVGTQHWAYDSISLGVQLKLISGFPDGTFRPEQPAAQSEAITVLYDILKLVKQANSTDTISGKSAGADSSGDVTIVWSTAMNAQGNIVAPGQDIPLWVQLINVKKVPAFLNWSANAGTFTDQQGTSAVWTAPMKEGEYLITVTAANKKGVKKSVTERFVVSNLAVEEEFIFGDPANFDVIGQQDTDSDGDGLLDSEEATLGTNPLMKDTDGDGRNDYEEVYTFKTDPTKAD